MIHLLFFLTVALVILQRVLELQLASRNRDYILSRGGYEVAAGHYKWIVLLHAGFFVSLIIEWFRQGPAIPDGWWFPFTLFMAAQGIRYWCIRSLGPLWNTRIMILPGSPRVKRGPYRFLRHPNYMVVTLEFLSFPMIFGLVYTAVGFSVLNMLLLNAVRIPAEEKAWMMRPHRSR